MIIIIIIKINALKKEDKKILKHKELIIEMKRTTDVQGNSDTATISKSLRQHPSKISAKHEIKKLQKT